VETERIRTQLERILASATFAEAERARKFLRLVVELALTGRHYEIKESVIGVEALGRTASYDPRTDPIVRVEAGRLRSRLLAYYQSEGTLDPILIDLPKGGYVPEFQERRMPQYAPGASATMRHPALIVGASLLIGFLLSWAAWFYLHKVPALSAPALLSVLPPEGSEFGNSAVSPDGRYLAFTATAGKLMRLWVRALDSLEAHALPGTDGASYPFWSPDSASVAFFTPGALKKIHVSGGAAQLICDVRAAFGGAWGARGVIVFVQRPNLYQVPAAGGTPKVVATIDPSRGEISYLFPHFLPDGRRFLYSLMSRAPGEATVRASSLDGGDFKFLLNADLGAAYAPPYRGHVGALIFAYHGALMSQPFDAQRLELTGAASQIAPEVRHVSMRADVSVSSNGVLAYQGNTEKDRQLTWFDRNGKELGTLGSRNNFRSFSLSPDEKRLAIEAEDPASGRSELWIMDLQRGSMSRIGAQALEGFVPVWSPDGNEIAFSANTSSGLFLWHQAADQLNAAPLLELAGPKTASDWSADGRFLGVYGPLARTTVAQYMGDADPRQRQGQRPLVFSRRQRAFRVLRGVLAIAGGGRSPLDRLLIRAGRSLREELSRRRSSVAGLHRRRAAAALATGRT
jgi:dipeptidyl aminopeptidase/acylaminoacyl peptidase